MTAYRTLDRGSPGPAPTDVGFFERGTEIPSAWIEVAPKDGAPFSIGKICFASDTDVSLKDGWVRLHILNHRENYSAFELSGEWANVSISFNYDMRVFGPDGTHLFSLWLAVGADIAIPDADG